MVPGAVPCGISADALTITDVMASLGLLTSNAAVGIELYLAKAGVLTPVRIINYIQQLAARRAERHSALRKMNEQDRDKFLATLAHYVFRDYSLSAASPITCSNCGGEKFVLAEVFTNKVAFPNGKPPTWAKTSRAVRPSDWEEWRKNRELVKVVCKPCNGKGQIKNECRCRGRGEVLDKKKTLLQGGVPSYKTCPRCGGRGYPRLKDTEVFKALGVTETTWRRNYKSLFDALVMWCHKEESFAENVLAKVTR
nr:antitermination protein [Enterobacter asburiae]